MKMIKKYIKINAFVALGCIMGLFLFALFVIGPYKTTSDLDTQIEYEVVCLGDSIFGNYTGDDSITSVLADITGKTVFNGGFGGTCAALRNLSGETDLKNDFLSLVEITKAFGNKDFSLVLSQMNGNNETLDSNIERNEETLIEMAHLDLEQTDYLFIEHGVNDYLYGVPIENTEDPMDETTYQGALRTAVESIRSSYPELTIVFCTPSYMGMYDEDGNFSGAEEVDFGGGTLDEYCAAMKEVAKEYDVQVLDHYNTLGITGENLMSFTLDGLHLNAEGRKKMAESMASIFE